MNTEYGINLIHCPVMGSRYFYDDKKEEMLQYALSKRKYRREYRKLKNKYIAKAWFKKRSLLLKRNRG